MYLCFFVAQRWICYQCPIIITDVMIISINQLNKSHLGLRVIYSLIIRIIQQISNNSMNKTTPSRKKLLLMEQFISLIIIFKTHLTELNIYIYYAVLFGFIVAKYFREGNTVGSIGQYIATLFLLISSMTGIFFLTHVGIVIAILNYMFIAPTIYTLPEFSPKVGLRDNYSKMKNNKQLYWAEWYPVAQDLKNQSYQVPWNHTVEIQKMAGYRRITNKWLLKAFRFFTSSTLKYRLTLAKGTPGNCKGSILFSHGRGGTPFIYSSILKAFARDWRVLSPQHSEVNVTPYTELKDIKRFRQIQVKQRAEQIVYLTNRIGQSEQVVLMGHSYGCATILQAYSTMPLSVRKRVSHIVLLDPWLFSLTDQVFNDQIICPILMLANQHFLSNQDVYTRNKQFIKRHHSKLIYLCWKGGDHLHQCDMAFIVGSSLHQIKNPKQCWQMMERNIQAIEMFLEFNKISSEEEERFRYRFSVYDIGQDYRPQKWANKLNF